MSLKQKINSAIWYAKAGIPVFPVRPTKEPYFKGGVYNATTNPEQVEAWFKEKGKGDALIAMACGSVSGMVVLDIDPRNGGHISLKKLIAQYGAFPEGPLSKTGSGGEHYFFAYPTLFKTQNGKVTGVDGIDHKTDGGYVILPPSKTTELYEWVRSIRDHDLPDLPGWIAERITANKSQKDFFDKNGKVKEGQRNEFLISLAGSMRRRGMGEKAIFAALNAENKERCAPPVDTSEIGTVTHSVMQYEPEDPALRDFQEESTIKEDGEDSEKVIAGFLLQDRDREDETTVEVVTTIKPDVMIDETSRMICRAAKDLYNQGSSLTLANIEDQLRLQNFVLSINDKENLIADGFRISRIGDAKFHLERITNAYQLRETISILKSGLSLASKGGHSPLDIVGDTVARFTRLSSQETKETFTVREANRQVRQMIENARMGIFDMNEPTGFLPLDRQIIGFPKDLIAIAARTSHGKTSLMLKLCDSMSERWRDEGEEGTILYFSAEMTARQLAMRFACRRARVNSVAVRKGQMTIDEEQRYYKALSETDERLNIIIDQKSMPTGSYILTKAMGVAAQYKLRMVVMDFIELVGGDDLQGDATQSKVRHIEEAMKALKALSKTLGIPVVAVAQLNRDIEKRVTRTDPPHPRITDLAWADMIGKLSDFIISLTYPYSFWQNGIKSCYPIEGPNRYDYMIHVQKNRDGFIGDIPILFLKEYGEFISVGQGVQEGLIMEESNEETEEVFA